MLREYRKKTDKNSVYVRKIRFFCNLELFKLIIITFKTFIFYKETIFDKLKPNFKRNYLKF